MASIELRNGTYRIVFRYGGQKFARSLKTTELSEANLALARLQDNLRRFELGTLLIESSMGLARRVGATTFEVRSSAGDRGSGISEACAMLGSTPGLGADQWLL